MALNWPRIASNFSNLRLHGFSAEGVGMMRLVKRPGRVFYRDGKNERRVHCSCEVCRLRFGRLFMPKRHRGKWRFSRKRC
jgi:hypothetical protein